MSDTPHFLLLAGEASGDQLGAALLKSIHARWPQAHTAGMGGTHMQEQGMDILVDAADMAIMGAVEVLTHIGRIVRAWRRLKRYLKQHKPLVILIDYPGFNLRFARLAHRLGCRVLYVVSPQVWAWKAGRVNTIQRVVDHMAVLFPFEKPIYDQASVPCSVIRHPLVDNTQRLPTSSDSYHSLNLNPDYPIIALCPGSRQKEIDSLLPLMFAACKLITAEHPSAQFVLCLSPTIEQANLDDAPEALQIIDGADHQVLSHVNAALVASGTMTLELALLEIPMVIAYRLHPITYWLATHFVSTQWVGLCNILMQQMIAPEHLQSNATAQQLADSCLYHLANPSLQRDAWQQLRGSLSGEPIGSLIPVIEQLKPRLDLTE